MPAKRLIPVLNLNEPGDRLVGKASRLLYQGADELAFCAVGTAEAGALPWLQALALPLARIAWAGHGLAPGELLAAGMDRVVMEFAEWGAMGPERLRASVRLAGDAEALADRLALEGVAEVVLEAGSLSLDAIAAWSNRGMPLALHWRGGSRECLAEGLAHGADAIYLDGPVEGVEGGLPELRTYLQEAGLVLRS